MSTQTATLAGGCFWCIETVFNRLAGVESAVSGYMGGHTPNPPTATSATATPATPKSCRSPSTPK